MTDINVQGFERRPAEEVSRELDLRAQAQLNGGIRSEGDARPPGPGSVQRQGQLCQDLPEDPEVCLQDTVGNAH